MLTVKINSIRTSFSSVFAKSSMADNRSNGCEPHSATVIDSQTQCRCGICFRPSWAQPLASPKLFLFIFCLLNVIQGMLFIYFVAVMTTVEQYFQMKSEALAYVLSFGEFVPVFVGFVLSIFLGEADRPRWTAFSSMLISIGSLIMSMPYFLWRVAHPEDRFEIQNDENDNSTGTLCLPVARSNFSTNWIKDEWTTDSLLKNNLTNCNLAVTQENNLSVILVYLTGYMVFNTGTTLLFVMGTPYLDDNVRQKDSPIYLAITCGIRTVGPMLGFLVAYVCLSIYVNPNEMISFGQEDRRWLGAWWLGYIIMSVVSAMGALLVAQFPLRIPSRHKTPAIKMAIMNTSENASNAISDRPVNEEKKKILHIKELIPVVRRQFSNFLLMSRIMATVFTVAGLEGFTFYLPKYYEHQFHVPTSEASIYSGASLIGPIILSDILVGLYLQKARPSARRLALILVIAKTIYALILPAIMLIKCDSAYIIGLDKISDCDPNCECPTLPFRPVCANGQNFLSACHAGCSVANISSKSTIYSNCSCVAGNEVIDSLCDGVCPKVLIYVLLTGCGKLLLGVEVVGGIVFLLRCVSPKDKTVAMGLSNLLLGYLAFFPVPIVFGTIVDSSCALWSTSCGQQGACLRYDMDRLRYLLHGVPFGLVLIGVFWDFMFFRKAGKLTLFGDEDDKVMPSDK